MAAANPTHAPRDVLAWAALVAALAVTVTAEYDLARAVGFDRFTAAGVPAALDIYAIRALRARRDVAAVVIAMVLVNASSHLVAAGLLRVEWPLVVAVSAIAPLVLWRVHRLAGPAPAPECAPDAPTQALAPDAAEPDASALDAAFERAASEAVAVAAPADAPAPVEAPAPAPALPPLPAGYTPASAPAPAFAAAQPRSTVRAAVPDADASESTSDDASEPEPVHPTVESLLADARAFDAECIRIHNRPASLRRMQSRFGIGQAKAQRLRAALDEGA